MTNEEALKILKYRSGWNLSIRDVNALEMAIEALEQEPCYNPDEWCRTCSEYDHDKHCCPRYNNVIRNAVEEMKQSCDDVINRILKRMWNCRGKHTTNIDKVKMEQIIRDELPFVTQPCEDAISRQAAIDAIKEIHPIDTEYDCTLYDKLDVIYVLKDLPSVNLQPRRGIG